MNFIFAGLDNLLKKYMLVVFTIVENELEWRLQQVQENSGLKRQFEFENHHLIVLFALLKWIRPRFLNFIKSCDCFYQWMECSIPTDNPSWNFYQKFTNTTKVTDEVHKEIYLSRMSNLVHCKPKIHLCDQILIIDGWTWKSVRVIESIIKEGIVHIDGKQPTVLPHEVIVSESITCITILSISHGNTRDEDFIISNCHIIEGNEINLLIY